MILERHPSFPGMEGGLSRAADAKKALMQMNVQLHHVVSDITGRTGMRIIRAIAAGSHVPEELAAYRDARCRASEATICAALTGLLPAR